MINIIKCEVYKLYKTKKIHILLFLVLVSLIFSAFSEFLVSNINLAKSSGSILPLSLLSSSSSFFIPIIVILSTTTLISNECSDGSLKLLLLKPFKRTTILIGKFFSIVLMVILMLLLLLILGYGFGALLFGFNDFMVIKGISISFKDSLFLTLSSYVVSVFAYMAFTALILLVCTIFTQPSYSSIISILILIVSLAIGAIEPSISPFLITSYFNMYTIILENGLSISLYEVVINLIYIIFFLTTSIIIFNKKDFKI